MQPRGEKMAIRVARFVVDNVGAPYGGGIHSCILLSDELKDHFVRAVGRKWVHRVILTDIREFISIFISSLQFYTNLHISYNRLVVGASLLIIP